MMYLIKNKRKNVVIRLLLLWMLQEVYKFVKKTQLGQ